MLLSELLTPDQILVPLKGTTKEELLRELVAVLHRSGAVSDPDAVLHSVMERERVLSTGIGSGVAIPHGKSDRVEKLAVAAGVTPRPVDFEALDGRPVNLFFLLVGPESAAGQHVKALSRIARLVRRDALRQQLVEAGSPEEFLSLVARAEEP